MSQSHMSVCCGASVSSILWRRLKYQLSPQLDLYKSVAPRVAGLDVLEIGFGTGIGAVQLAERASRVVAIETDGDAVEFARETLPLVNIKWVHGDILNMQWYEAFDVVTMIEVLEHIGDWEQALTNVAKLLKPGGKLFISARNANADLRPNGLHERELTAQEFKDALRQCFLRVTLYDYQLRVEQKDSTHQTPLIAVAH